MKTIKIYTNLVMYGWDAKQYETGLGGSEEKLVELAEYLAKDNKVIIYMNGVHGEYNGVSYQDHRAFKPWEPFDVFISFKNKEILTNSINASKILYFTTEIEPKFFKYELDTLDQIVYISNYHASRSINNEKTIVQYLWADYERMDKNKVDKEEGSMLYSSSFDRGLEDLLNNWSIVKDKLGVKKLYITYGWDFVDRIAKHNPPMVTWKKNMQKLIEKNKDIVMLGKVNIDEMYKMYWKSQYWVLPLNNPDSELFCINAIKAQYAGCIPVVNKIGALQETVNEYIDYKDVIAGKILPKVNLKANKLHAQKFSMKKQLKDFKTYLL